MEPSTLFELSWRATVRNAKEGRIDLDSQSFPIDFAEKVFKLTEHTLFTDAFHPRTIRWFSENIFPRPQEMYVEIGKGRFRHTDHYCKICLWNPEEDDPYSFWFRWELILSNDYTDTVMVQFGSKILPTKFKEDRNIPPSTNKYIAANIDQEICITSYVTDLKHTRHEMIDWICQAFHCDISILDISETIEDDFNEWPRFRDAKCLGLFGFDDYEVWLPVMRERQRKNLRTKLYFPHTIRKPLPASVLFLIDLRDSHFNLSEYTFDEFIDFIKQIVNKNFDRLTLHGVPRMSAEQFENFKTQFNLLEGQEERLFQEYGITGLPRSDRNLCRFRDDHVAIFELFQDEEGVCREMRIREKEREIRS